MDGMETINSFDPRNDPDHTVLENLESFDDTLLENLLECERSLLHTTSDFPDEAGHAAVLLGDLNLTEADLGWIEGETNSKTELGVHQ